jgi:hypothetical protein
MAVNYVKGQILSSNLERDGIDLSISNANVGINTVSPSSTFEVAGIFTVGNVIISNIGNISAGNVNINNLAEPVVNADATTKFYVDSLVGNIGNAGNLTFSNTTISTNLGTGNITLAATGNAFVQINGTYGFVLPAGNTSQRLGTGNVAGTLRFNTETGRVEVYDGTEWDQVGQGAVTNQVLYGDGSTETFTLDRSTTTAAVLVILNGITQVPVQSYSMVPSPSANLVFTEAPEPSDVIDIRFL